MRWTVPTVLFFLCCLPLGVHAQAVNPINEQDRTDFDDLFGAKLEFVTRSRDTGDDLQLADEMMRFADSVPDSPGVQCLIYIESIPLAGTGGDLTLALRAADRLGSAWPGHPAGEEAALLELAERVYRGTDREARAQVAEPYLILLLRSAGGAEQREELDRAIALCRQANTIARAVGSDQRERIEETLERLSESKSLSTRIEMLATSVRNNPQNMPAAHELVELLVVGKDDPAAAAEFAPLTGDPDLAEVVAMCAAGIATASAPAALRVGDWYLALADGEPDDQAEPLLRRARAWYARFMEVYPRQDALAQRVASMDLIAEGRVRRIHQAQREAMRGQWIDLIADGFDPQAHAIGEGVERVNGELISNESGFVLPTPPPTGDYELRVQLTIQQGAPGLVVHLPVGRTAATFRYAWDNNSRSRIDGLGVEDRERARLNRVGQRVTLLFQAAVLNNGEVGLAMLVDDQPSLNWRGDAGRVRPDNNHRPPAEMGRVIGIGSPGQVTFHKVELRERVE